MNGRQPTYQVRCLACGYRQTERRDTKEIFCRRCGDKRVELLYEIPEDA